MFCKYEEQFENYRIRKNDILIGGTGHYSGKSIISSDDMYGMIHSYNIIRLVVKKIYPKYCFFYLNSQFIRELMDLSVTGSGQPFLDFERINNLIILIPPFKEQQQIVDYLDTETTKIDSTIEKETQRIDLLKEYRQSLISNVVTGKVDIRDEVVV
jgi:type I restriction enzyme S subunit